MAKMHAVNLAEKLAGTYLRLNGFLTLPQFTVFDGCQHNHIDIVGFRVANSREVVNGHTLETDNEFFKQLSLLPGLSSSQAKSFGIAAEVRTNGRRKAPSGDHIRYVRSFLGDFPVARLAFFKRRKKPTFRQDGEVLQISMRHAALWIQQRIDSMHGIRLTKKGSWTWSESFLSDLLALQGYGFGFAKLSRIRKDRSRLPTP